MRHLGDADTAEHEAGGADTVEVHVAREVVSAGAQWLERRRQSRLELDERADRRRGALAHRDPHALQRLIKPRTGNALDPHDDAVRALALFPDLDEARDIDVPDRRRQHGVSDDRALGGGGRQPSRQGGGTQRQGKRERSPPREDGRRRRRSEQETRRPWRGLAVDGEIDRDAATECDGEPGHEPSRADLDRHPRADALCRSAREIGQTVRPCQCRPTAGRGPRCDPGPPSFGPATRSVLLDHRAAPRCPRYNFRHAT